MVATRMAWWRFGGGQEVDERLRLGAIHVQLRVAVGEAQRESLLGSA